MCWTVHEEIVDKAQIDTLAVGKPVAVKYHSNNPSINAASDYGYYVAVGDLPKSTPTFRLFFCLGFLTLGVAHLSQLRQLQLHSGQGLSTTGAGQCTIHGKVPLAAFTPAHSHPISTLPINPGVVAHPRQPPGVKGGSSTLEGLGGSCGWG